MWARAFALIILPAFRCWYICCEFLQTVVWLESWTTLLREVFIVTFLSWFRYSTISSYVFAVSPWWKYSYAVGKRPILSLFSHGPKNVTFNLIYPFLERWSCTWTDQDNSTPRNLTRPAVVTDSWTHQTIRANSCKRVAMTSEHFTVPSAIV